MSSLKTAEGERPKEQESIPPKTGLRLIETAVSEPRLQWFEMDFRQNSLFRTLRMVGDNGVWGTFYLNPISFVLDKKGFLEGLKATKIDTEGQVEGPYLAVAQKLRELKGEKAALLVLNEEVKSDYPLPDYLGSYEISTEAFDDLMGWFRENDEGISRGELARGGYSLSTGILNFEFPRPNSDQNFSFGILVHKKRPWGQDFGIGEALPWVEKQLEASRELEQFLVENWSHFETLFKNWQR